MGYQPLWLKEQTFDKCTGIVWPVLLLVIKKTRELTLIEWYFFKVTWTPRRLVGSSCRERAVNAVVTYAMKIAIAMRPNKIQTTEKIRAMADLGALSPYLANKKGTNWKRYWWWFYLHSQDAVLGYKPMGLNHERA